MVINSVKSVRDEVFKAYEVAKVAENEWQAELDRLKVERYSRAARGTVDSRLRELYERKIAADLQLAELTDTMRRYQDPQQVLGEDGERSLKR